VHTSSPVLSVATAQAEHSGGRGKIKEKGESGKKKRPVFFCFELVKRKKGNSRLPAGCGWKRRGEELCGRGEEGRGRDFLL